MYGVSLRIFTSPVAFVEMGKARIVRIKAGDLELSGHTCPLLAILARRNVSAT